MRKIWSLFLLLAAAWVAVADVSPQQAYIDKYAKWAVQEMYRSGVPASITLAQGMLESRYGLSELAAKGNNHFGIKCHDWKGKTMRVDDDRKGECFRVYGSAYDSFKDHSDFLRYRDRYKFLFDFDVTDYKSWANGLSKAGYATDPQYPAKLIKLIEDYGLSRFDTDGEDAPAAQQPAASAASDAPDAKPAPRRSRRREKLPESPTVLEESVALDRKAAENFHFSLSRTVYMQNGVPFVRAVEGESFESIARMNNLFYKEILRFNDLSSGHRLQPGERVYLHAKKNYTKKGLDKYIVESDGEVLHDICQRFGVKEKSIMKLNKFTAGHVLREGDTVLLR